MRSSKSRSRGNKNRNNRPTGGSIVNRVFDSSGPDGKVRGTPQQIVEKYNQLHRDAQLANDRVHAEDFAQHAEHYQRLLTNAQREIDKNREEQEAQNRERQAERDRERQARVKAQEEAAQDPANAPQPGFTPPAQQQSNESNADLVVTPEERAAEPNVQQPSAQQPTSDEPQPRKERQPRQRRPRRKPVADTAPKSEPTASDAPAAAAAEAPAAPDPVAAQAAPAPAAAQTPPAPAADGGAEAVSE